MDADMVLASGDLLMFVWALPAVPLILRSVPFLLKPGFGAQE